MIATFFLMLVLYTPYCFPRECSRILIPMLGIFLCFVVLVASDRPCEEDGFVSHGFHLY